MLYRAAEFLFIRRCLKFGFSPLEAMALRLSGFVFDAAARGRNCRDAAGLWNRKMSRRWRSQLVALAGRFGAPREIA